MKPNISQAAVIVVDMQNDFYGEGGNAEGRGKKLTKMRSVAARIDEFVAPLRAAGALVVFTKFMYDDEKSPSAYRDMMDAAKNSNYMCRVGTKGAELDGVSPQNGDEIIEKYTYDAFADTNLNELLKQRGVTDVIITGVRTEVCVLATASRAFAENYHVFIVEDLVATYDTYQAEHDSVLSILGKATAIIINSRETSNA